MFTEREKQVLGKYLTWYLVMRSDELKLEQGNIKDIVEQLKANNESFGSIEEFAVFEYKDQDYAFHYGSEELYQIDKITRDVIEHYNIDKNSVSVKLAGKYPEDELKKVCENINNVVMNCA